MHDIIYSLHKFRVVSGLLVFSICVDHNKRYQDPIYIINMIRFSNTFLKKE